MVVTFVVDAGHSCFQIPQDLTRRPSVLVDLIDCVERSDMAGTFLGVEEHRDHTSRGILAIVAFGDYVGGVMVNSMSPRSQNDV